MIPVIRYSGSKKDLRKYVVSFFPTNCNNYYEPFCGGCSVLYTTIENNLFKNYFASDLYKPLIDTLLMVKNNPQLLLTRYTFKWYKLRQDPEYYYNVRKSFNERNNPYDFFFLSRTCMNGLMRFNPKGNFNSARHLGRDGLKPKNLTKVMEDWNQKLQLVNISCCDFEDIKTQIKGGDFVYLDPPYYIKAGFYYCKKLDVDKLIDFMKFCNLNEIKFCLSYNNDEIIPSNIYKRKITNKLVKNVFRKFQKNFTEKTDFLFLNY